MTLTQLAFEVPAGDTTAQVFTPVGPISYVHPGDSLGSLAAATGRTFGALATYDELPLGRYFYSPGAAPDPTYAQK